MKGLRYSHFLNNILSTDSDSRYEIVTNFLMRKRKALQPNEAFLGVGGHSGFAKQTSNSRQAFVDGGEMYESVAP